MDSAGGSGVGGIDFDDLFGDLFGSRGVAGPIPGADQEAELACARLRTEIDSMPAELDEVTRRVMRLEIKEAALAKETDPASLARLNQLRKELADLRAEADAMRAQWETERQAIRRVQELRAELERVRREVEEAERAYDLNRAAELRYSTLADLERRLAAEEAHSPSSRASTGCCARWSPKTK